MILLSVIKKGFPVLRLAMLTGVVWSLSPLSADAVDMQPGTVIGRHIFGLAHDSNGDPLLHGDLAVIHGDSVESVVVNHQNKAYQVSAFDDQVGGVYLTRLNDDQSSAIDTESLDLAAVGGISHPGTLGISPWNSVLISERVAIDRRNSVGFIWDFKDYFKGNAELINPYNYGWLSELIILNEEGEAKLIKNYAAGRVAATDALLMPDEKTWYLLDKNGSGLLYLFVSEEPRSLSSGELFVVDLGKETPRLVSLGKQNSLKLKFKLKKIDFADLFEAVEPRDGACAKGYTHISTQFGEECLKPNKKNDRYAGQFEPVRVAALHGVVASGQKTIGVTYDTATNSLNIESSQHTTRTLKLIANEQLNSQYAIR